MAINNYLVTSSYYFSQSNANFLCAFAGGIVIQYRIVFRHCLPSAGGFIQIGRVADGKEL
jgi:hypothetical protein